MRERYEARLDRIWSVLCILLLRPLGWAVFLTCVPPMLFITLAAVHELWTWYLALPIGIFLYHFFIHSIPDFMDFIEGRPPRA